MGTSRNGQGLKYLAFGIAAGIVSVCVLASAMAASDQRPLCASCHLMREAAVTHKMGTHADQPCNACHAPRNAADRLPFKAREGIRDFFANLSGKDLPYPVADATRRTINENCKSCHAQTNMTAAAMIAKPYCVDCHRNVAHMRLKPVSTRMVAYE
ncbi:MAG: NapC/NirT family cytochrome c [Desulfovibrio sp.]|jgi:cytochrome c nitrite reductase small subunit|nr:NapC/NirT family cytochrome c [Desulfovibrio sp.]